MISEPMFDAVDGPPAAPSGFRLWRLEVLNWGTFDRRVWTLDAGGSNILLTGDIGSGKSTLVDAVTTLLLPSNKISYNKAAGAMVRERDLRSYVQGYYKFEGNEVTGSSRPVGLRTDARSYSVILGVFAAGDTVVTLAQVFWMKQGQAGQPDRFFVVAEGDLSITEDLAGFGTEINALRRRLRADGAHVYDSFAPYGTDFRRRLGIDSAQAMDLFHQTVSMKSVSNLNDFVRSHMLEPFDADSWIASIIEHFEDLTRAHEAVLKARSQLELLGPLLAECDLHGQVLAQVTALVGQRDALPFHAARRREALFEDAADGQRLRIKGLDRDADELDQRSRELTDKRSALEVERAGHGGDRLRELERRILECARERARRRNNAARFAELLREAGLPELVAREQFSALCEHIAALGLVSGDQLADVTNREKELAVEEHRLRGEVVEVREELASLGRRRSNIPRRSLELRERICVELGLAADVLPFAGELIQVRDEASEWEGAAERLLRGFGLSVLVPDEHYERASDWIDTHHLGMRLVYYRVPAAITAGGPGPAGPDRLVRKLQIKEDTPFYPWLERELSRRAGHVCAATMAQFRRAEHAVTRAGQVKGAAGRHEKDDARAIGDRRFYILGWTNQGKVDALLEQASALAGRRQELEGAGRAVAAQCSRIESRARALDLLGEYRSFDELDWEAMVRRIAEDEAEKARIERSSQELERVSAELSRVVAALQSVGEMIKSTGEELGAARRDLRQAEEGLRTCREVLARTGAQAAGDHADDLDARAPDPPPEDPGGWDQWEAATRDAILGEIDDRHARLRTTENRIIAMMDRFRSRFPTETVEMDSTIAAVGEYRRCHDRLAHDDLPRFEAEFKSYLNVNTIRDIAGFQSALRQQADLIRERVDRINRSLVGIDYNEGRYIRLEAAPTPNVEIRDFRQELRACTDNAVSGGDEQYSEQKFLQVKHIVERFRGRDGQTDADRAWTRRVCDVRNWFVFTASERWRADGTEHETYADSGGKSGGQKEKLAYTILAASLAYQFRLDQPDSASTFRFVVIDEAFGRGSDESTRFALSLFGLLGLQLLIVTPLQKIHVIEPYVRSVGYVDNRSGGYSRLHTLTIEEFREQRRQYALAAQLVQVEG